MEFIELILINKLDGVILRYPHHDNVDGTVCITGHHLILSSRKEGVRELWVINNRYILLKFILMTYLNYLFLYNIPAIAQEHRQYRKKGEQIEWWSCTRWFSVFKMQRFENISTGYQ